MVNVAQLSEYSKTTEFYTLSSKWYVNKSLIKSLYHWGSLYIDCILSICILTLDFLGVIIVFMHENVLALGDSEC